MASWRPIQCKKYHSCLAPRQCDSSAASPRFGLATRSSIGASGICVVASMFNEGVRVVCRRRRCRHACSLRPSSESIAAARRHMTASCSRRRATNMTGSDALLVSSSCICCPHERRPLNLVAANLADLAEKLVSSGSIHAHAGTVCTCTCRHRGRVQIPPGYPVTC